MDGADNATFSLFQATNEEFADLFMDGTDIELIDKKCPPGRLTPPLASSRHVGHAEKPPEQMR